MTRHDELNDEMLKQEFQAMRDEERESAPSFDSMSGRAAEPSRVRWLHPGLAVAAGLVLTVGVLAVPWIYRGGEVAVEPPVVAHTVEPREILEFAPETHERLKGVGLEEPEDAVLEETPTPAADPAPAAGPPETPSEAVAPSEARERLADVLAKAAAKQPADALAEGAPELLAQASGDMKVQVTDSEGNPLPGAAVILSDGAVPLGARAVITDQRGTASFSSLPAKDAYDVNVTFPGMRGVRLEGVRVAESNRTDLPVQLAEEYGEAVAVTAERPVVELYAADTTSKFSDDFIAGLPVQGRAYQDPNVHGSRSRDFKAIVRGVSNVDPLHGQLSGYVAMDSIEEMEAVAAGEGVKFDGAQGGFARVDDFGSTETYGAFEDNDFHRVAEDPLSTFSADVDTASYANVRRFLNEGSLPPRDAVRIEELINYFDYRHAEPKGDDPFGVEIEVAECPWNRENWLARVTLAARNELKNDYKGSNLVFLLDVSGSMDSPDKLPLVKDAMRMLSRQLGSKDSVAIVVYAGAAGLVLPPGSDQQAILSAIDRLGAGGGTAGGSGLRLAYRVARENFIEGGVNRVILATDGDFNVGVTGHSELMNIIGQDAKNGIFLTALGVGRGNFQDQRLEQLADKGNGNFAYLDSKAEARKVLVEEIGSTLVTVAKDVKFQLEFNPARVGAYRLIGYENRLLAHRDFNDDTKDAGEVGAGHTVTVLYELVPAGREQAPLVDPLKYQRSAEPQEHTASDDLFTLKVRFKHPDEDTSSRRLYPVSAEPLPLGAASEDTRFAAAVAAFGLRLRHQASAQSFDWSAIERLARDGIGNDEHGYRAGFIDLIHRAAARESALHGE